jgi:glycine/D-amino acid oxidase-like deaminating enzyme
VNRRRSDFRQVGYLFLITADRDVTAFDARSRCGSVWCPAQRLDAAGSGRSFRAPTTSVRDLLRGRHLDLVVAEWVCARAREGRFAEGEAVTAVDRDSGSVSTVLTASRAISCSTVVNAAGAWAARSAPVGLELPAPLRGRSS